MTIRMRRRSRVPLSSWQVDQCFDAGWIAHEMSEPAGYVAYPPADRPGLPTLGPFASLDEARDAAAQRWWDAEAERRYGVPMPQRRAAQAEYRDVTSDAPRLNTPR